MEKGNVQKFLSMERPTRVSHRLLEIFEFLEGRDALTLLGFKTVVSGF